LINFKISDESRQDYIKEMSGIADRSGRLNESEILKLDSCYDRDTGNKWLRSLTLLLTEQ